MTDIVLVKDNDGALVGFRDVDRRAWARLKKILANLEIGELITLRFWFKKNRRFHNKHLKLVRTFYDSQERFEGFDPFRYWLTIGAEWCIWVPGSKGGIIPIAKSISDEECDDEDMAVVHEGSIRYLRTEYAQKQLWPHLSAEERVNMVEKLLESFERPQQ